MATKTISTCALLYSLLATTSLFAQGDKWFEIEGAVNANPSFMVGVDVNHENRIYREGDKLTVSVVAETDCYLYLIYESGENAAVLFPNKYEEDNFIRGNEVIQIPRKNTYNIVCRPPFGTESLYAFATKQPVPLFKEKDFKLEQPTSVNQSDLRGMVSQLQTQAQDQWAEARLSITTMSANGKPKKSKKLAVCIGISEYQQKDRIQQLQVSHLDAGMMAAGLRDHCGVQDITVLQNQDATRENIEKAIFHDLVQKSSPGDTVYIFFSGHGGRTADTNGDEADGYDEYLVPHDGELGKPETMILDDTFARWMQELDGRKVVIVMDSCHSGGASKSTKGLQTGGPSPRGALDFFDGEMRRSKDLGQNNTVILAACEANQLAWEIPEKGQGSVLTNYLLKSLGSSEADANGDGKLSVQEAFEHSKSSIQDFVQQTFGATQTPVLIDNANDSIYFRD